MLQDKILTKMNVTLTVDLRPDAAAALASDIEDAVTDVLAAYVSRHVADDGFTLNVARSV